MESSLVTQTSKETELLGRPSLPGLLGCEKETWLLPLVVWGLLTCLHGSLADTVALVTARGRGSCQRKAGLAHFFEKGEASPGPFCPLADWVHMVP